jgi:hypothetical protein
LHKVKVVQHADPDDAGQHMEVAKEKLNIRHACVSRFFNNGSKAPLIEQYIVRAKSKI